MTGPIRAILYMVTFAVCLSVLPAAAQSPFDSGYRMFQDGNYIGAARVWGRLAREGDPQAQNALGYLYKNGFGVEQNYQRALRWYRAAAEQGRPQAVYDLGLMYDEGLGIPRDFAEARTLYSRAARDGIADAHNNLGVIYANGNGVQTDLHAAYYYYAMADRLGGSKMARENRRFTGAKLNAADRDRIDRLVRGAPPGALFPDHRSEPAPSAATPPPEDAPPEDAPPPLSASETRRLQTALARLGFDPGPVDGILGPATRSALAAYREEYATDAPLREMLREMEYTVARLPPMPNLSVELPEKVVGREPVLTVAGRIEGGSGAKTVTIDGEAVTVGADGGFRHDLYLVDEERTVTVLITDADGTEIREQVVLRRERTASAEGLDIDLPPLNPVRAAAKPNTAAVALVIGTQEYRTLPPALFAERDALAFADYARHALGVPASRIKVLNGEAASYGAIRKALEVWLPAAVDPGGSDVFVFFAGHGLSAPAAGMSYLLPQDADAELLRYLGISKEEMIDGLSRLGARSVTVILDTCFSGPGRTGELLVAARPVFSVPETATPGGVAILSAATGTQIAGTLPDRRHGLFSYFVMRGLEGEADADGNGLLTVGELNDWIGPRVTRAAGLLGRPAQTPGLEGDPGAVIARY